MEIPSENFISISEKMCKVKLIAGRSNLELAQGISERLDIQLTDLKITDFNNTELNTTIQETVRGFDVFIIQTGGFYQDRSINDHLVELFAIIHACKLSSAKSITVIMPCYAYARSDKHDMPRVPIMGSCLAHILQSVGVDRIVSMDLHSGQIQGFFQIPMDNLYGINLHIENFKNVLFKGLSKDEINENFVLASPDIGAARRIEAYAKRLGMKHVLMHKHRNYDLPGTVLNSILIGEPNVVCGKSIILIDDIFDSFGTVNAAIDELIKHGAKNAFAVATHGIFSGEAFDKINNNKFIEKVIVMNTIPQLDNLKKTDKLQIIDISDLFSQVIMTIQTGGSVSKLFI